VRVLLDECVDRRFAHELSGHEVETVAGLGWAGVKNGELLGRATDRFDVFVTVDRNLAFQQPIDKLALAVVILRARSNRLADLKPLVPVLLGTEDCISPLRAYSTGMALRHSPNHRALRLAPNRSLSSRSATLGSWYVPVGLGPEKKSTSTRPIRPAPNSI
jgi:hypothetical protein